MSPHDQSANRTPDSSAAATSPRIALVTARGAWQTDDDALPLVAALDELSIAAEPAVWDDAGVDWATFDLVVLRSPWDYTDRVEEFLAWADRVQAVAQLVNPADMLRWNTDKRYLGELHALGLSVVPTTYLLAADHAEIDSRLELPLLGDFVVKPTVSSGSRNTARYTQDEHATAEAHARRLLAVGRDVMVQPYIGSVDLVGETGMLFFGGAFSHGFRKGPLLGDGPAKVDGLYAQEQIDPRHPDAAELQLADDVLRAVAQRFGGAMPVYSRVDVLRGERGQPMVLELELTEPSYFLATDPLSAQRAAAAYAIALRRGSEPAATVEVT